MEKIEVYIPLLSETNVGGMVEWTREEGIELIKISPRHSENAFSRAMIYGYAFEFETLEDAAAFKLRWL